MVGYAGGSREWGARLTAPGEGQGKLSRLVVFHTRTRPFSLVGTGRAAGRWNLTAHYDALNLHRVGPAGRRHLPTCCYSPSDSGNQNLGAAGRKGKKKKKKTQRRPLQPQVQVESSRSRPPGTRLDQVGGVARPWMSDWEKG